MMKYFDKLMRLLTDRMPRKVAISAIVSSATLLFFAVLYPVLGGAHTDAIADNESSKSGIAQTTRNLKAAKDDYAYVVENRAAYEELLNGDRLVPHTRKVAMAQIRNLALQRGLTQVGYNFTVAGERSGAAAASQPIAGGYKVQVEHVDLKISASLDTQAYDFLLDLGDSFPGAAIIQQVTLERAPELTTDALNQVSRGADSGLVKGTVQFAWRTAQAQESEEKKASEDKIRGRR